MLLMNEFTQDLRVQKEGISLINDQQEVVIIALKDKYTKRNENRNGISVYRMSISTRWLPKNYFFWFIKYIEFMIRSIIAGVRVSSQAVHAHDLNTLFIGWVVKKIRRIPLVYDSHELYIDRITNPLAFRLWKTIESFAIKQVDRAYAENVSRAQVLEQRYNVTGILPLRNCQHLNLTPKNDYLRKKLNIKLNQKIILYQGLVTRLRGVDKLIEMMRFLPRESYCLVIIGPGKFVDQAKVIIKQDKLHNIHVIGNVALEELPRYTASADLGISLIQNVNKNHYYALSNKIFEYLSAGLPIVFSNFPEMKRVIEEEQVGYVVDETNPEQAATAVRKILEDTTLYEQMVNRAYGCVKEKYNWDNEVQDLMYYYRRVDNNE
ncbi:MAG: glycosyltransferase family 4 protein [Candidatus Marinimicrobia bacterium]|nr:glycosyltransferase family 4 protein [Candidatus Neomarinimicrobiota bacterium]